MGQTSWPVDKLTSGQGRRKRGGEINSGNIFQVSGLGSREPGSGVQVRDQVRDLNFTPHPYLHLITRTRDLRAET